MTPPKLKLTDEAFQGLHMIVDKTRASSEFVKVPRESLVRLLADHGQAMGFIEEVTKDGS